MKKKINFEYLDQVEPNSIYLDFETHMEQVFDPQYVTLLSNINSCSSINKELQDLATNISLLLNEVISPNLRFFLLINLEKMVIPLEENPLIENCHNVNTFIIKLLYNLYTNSSFGLLSID